MCPTLQLSHSGVPGVGLGWVLEPGGPESFPRLPGVKQAGLQRIVKYAAAIRSFAFCHLLYFAISASFCGFRAALHYQSAVFD